VEHPAVRFDFDFEIYAELDILSIVQSVKLEKKDEIVPVFGIFHPLEHFIGSCRVPELIRETIDVNDFIVVNRCQLQNVKVKLGVLERPREGPDTQTERYQPLIRDLLGIELPLDLVELHQGVYEVGRFNLPLEELIEYLDVSDLTCNCQSFLVHGPFRVIVVHGIHREVCLIGELVLREQQEADHHQPSPALACLAVDSDCCIFIASVLMRIFVEGHFSV
jgi:hypothetical protein